MIKEIPGYPNYFVDTDGNVYSNKSGELKRMFPWLDGKGNYLQIGLMKDGERHRLLVHRLVAITFIPNPNNLPEVNHKDKNKTNCAVTNLEWCDRMSNLIDSYSTLPPTRNFVECELYVDDVLVDKFKTLRDACLYANEKYNVSFSSLYRHFKIKNIYVKRLINNM